HDSDTEYLLAIFGEAVRLHGMAGLFNPAHNPLFRLPPSGDGAMALICFFREVLPETGEQKVFYRKFMIPDSVRLDISQQFPRTFAKT
ncbi:MAG TPA: hypothetical protein VL996_02375, partial [Methylocella sp.]|nr:hypothetical protein [Methylocella sp.]